MLRGASKYNILVWFSLRQRSRRGFPSLFQHSRPKSDKAPSIVLLGSLNLFFSRANPIWFPSKLARRGCLHARPLPQSDPSLFATKSVFVCPAKLRPTRKTPRSPRSELLSRFAAETFSRQ